MQTWLVSREGLGNRRPPPSRRIHFGGDISAADGIREGFAVAFRSFLYLVPRSGRLRPPRYQWVASPHLCASAHRPPTRGRSGSVPLVVVAPPARPLRGRHRWDHNTHTYTAEASDVPFCPSRPRSRRSTAVTPPERASDHCEAGHGVSLPSRPPRSESKQCAA